MKNKTRNTNCMCETLQQSRLIPSKVFVKQISCFWTTTACPSLRAHQYSNRMANNLPFNWIIWGWWRSALQNNYHSFNGVGERGTVWHDQCFQRFNSHQCLCILFQWSIWLKYALVKHAYCMYVCNRPLPCLTGLHDICEMCSILLWLT